MILTPNTLYNTDCQLFMKKVPANYFNIIYTDVPYNMGSEYIIDKYGHYRLKGKGSDFMNQWEVGDGIWWFDWFKEAYRITKPGGFLITHNIDRQSDLWSYYARRSGFFPLQKLYWLFIDSFPKGVDTALKIDNMLEVKRDVIGTAKGAQAESTGRYGAWGKGNLYGKGAKDQSMTHHNYLTGKMSEYDKTVATSDLAKKYDGYKHGIAPLKQVVEEILVFWKQPTDNVSRMIQRFENELPTGHTSIHPSVFNIKDTRVPSKDLSAPDRWTPQLLIPTNLIEPMIQEMNHEDSYRLIDILPKIKFTDEDMVSYNYCKKPSIIEQETGLENFTPKVTDDGRKKPNDTPFQRGETKRKNTHPTKKPIALSEWVIKLFMIPDKSQMRGFDPFAGQGTIPIAFQNLGIEWNGTELSSEFFHIAEARIKGFKDNSEFQLFN